jgi:hypothetical protein
VSQKQSEFNFTVFVGYMLQISEVLSGGDKKTGKVLRDFDPGVSA